MNAKPPTAPGIWARSGRLRPVLVGLVALVSLWLWWPTTPAAARGVQQTAQAIQPYLDRVAEAVTEFTAVVPRDYKRVMELIRTAEAAGRNVDEAVMGVQR